MKLRTALFHQKFGEHSALEQQKIWLGLCSLGRTQHEIDAMINTLTVGDSTHVLKAIFSQNLSEFTLSISPDKPVIATSFYCSVTCNQMSIIADALNSSKTFEHIACVWLSELSEEQCYNTKDFEELSFIAIPDISDSKRLKMLNAIFLSELNQYCHWQFPSSVIKVGYPHGADISIQDSLIKYGGIFHYDYLIQTKAKPIEQQLELYVVKENGKTFNIGLLPFGVPKIDVLYQNALKNDKENIIAIHLSNWQLENHKSRHQIKPLIDFLLANFCDYHILVRPFPGDLVNPSLNEQLAAFNDCSRVSVDTENSYVTAYAKVAILITQRLTTGQNFSLATFRPTIALVDQVEEIRQQPLGYSVNNLQSLVIKVRESLDEHEAESHRIESYARNSICHLGDSIDCLLLYLSQLVLEKNSLATEVEYINLTGHSDYKRVFDQALSDGVFIAQSIERQQALIESSSNHTHQWLTYYLIEAYSQSPNPVEHQFYFSYWYKACALFFQLLQSKVALETALVLRLQRWIRLIFSEVVQQFSLCANASLRHQARLLIEQITAQPNFIKLVETNLLAKKEVNLAQLYWWRFDFKSLLDAMHNHKDIYLFGANDICKQAIYLLENFTLCKIHKIIDNSPRKQKTMSLEYPILSLEELDWQAESCQVTNKPLMVICSFQYGEQLALSVKRQFPDIFTLFKVSPSL